MNKPELRVVHSDRTERELDMIAGVAKPKTVSIPLSKIVPLLVDASTENRVWLEDFASELVNINSDLYEVLLAYRELNHHSASQRAA